MKSLSRILGCVGAVTLCVAACNDKDVSLIQRNPGVGGSDQGGNGGSSGSSGAAGSSGNGGSSGSAGNGGGAGGNNTAGSAGSSGSSGAAGSPVTDPDGGVDGGPDATAPERTVNDICNDWCTLRNAFGGAVGAPADCAGYDGSSCVTDCLGEFEIFEDILQCTEHRPMIECFIVQNDWYCTPGASQGDPPSLLPDSCAQTGNAPGCNSTCDAEATAQQGCI